MTSLLQKPLKQVLPFLKRFVKPGNQRQGFEQAGPLAGPDSFYQLSSQLHTGHTFSFAGLRGKQVLLVNTTANATETNQYRELQQLAAQFADELVVLAFPTDDFAEQESPTGRPSRQANAARPLSLMQPSVVLKTAQQHPVYQWLSTARHNGWNEQAPPRPFTKYLISRTGQLAHYFGPTLSPLSETIIASIQNPAS